MLAHAQSFMTKLEGQVVFCKLWLGMNITKKGKTSAFVIDIALYFNLKYVCV